jgi:hypothetical protein
MDQIERESLRIQLDTKRADVDDLWERTTNHKWLRVARKYLQKAEVAYAGQDLINTDHYLGLAEDKIQSHLNMMAWGRMHMKVIGVRDNDGVLRTLSGRKSRAIGVQYGA